MKIAYGMQPAFQARDTLFDLANEYALRGQGEVAGHLHEAANCVLRANNVANGEPAQDPFDAINSIQNEIIARQLGLK